MTSATLLRSRAADGTTYQEAGSGEPLVLIHGVGMRLEAWEPQLRALSGLRRVIAIDMPGHGGSQCLPYGARLPEFVAWFGRFLDDLNLTSVAVAGHSMGALIAGGAAATYGARIDRVALINGVYRRSPEARAAVIARSREIDAGHVDLAAPLARWFSASEVGSGPYALVRDWLASVDVAGYGTAYAAFAEGDDVYADAWPDVNCPALFLTGEHDPNSTPQMSRAMAAAAPYGEAVIVAGHRHMVNLTAPDLVNAALAAWLDGRRAA
ncbi:alpha/beta hydrolase [Boseaceae bacterium BT-24-1]|nr:alpha/beta hydrolase [Boseaceae bacterium BT-24-1]